MYIALGFTLVFSLGYIIIALSLNIPLAEEKLLTPDNATAYSNI